MRIIFVVAAVSLVHCAALAAEDKGLTVNWNGGTINFPKYKTDGERPKIVPNNWPKVDCGFDDQRTKCWILRKQLAGKKNWEPYGRNLKFVEPIAIIPEGDDKSSAATNSDWNEPGKESGVAKLKPYVFAELSEAEIAAIPNKGEFLGSSGESRGYSEATVTVGGAYALNLWQRLKGKRPTRECLTSDYCSIVMDGRLPGRDALAYCEIMNSSVGVGIPFNCQVVAYKRDGQPQWYVLSYDSPEQCDGCGAAEGASCQLETQASFEKVAEVLVAALKTGRTNIELKQFKKTKNSIEFIGQNEGTPSKFYANYYDKSYAHYSVSRSDEAKNTVEIVGLFNLVISVAPTAGGKSYREIGNAGGASDPAIIWFQGEVLDIVKKDVAGKLKANVTCEVQPIY